MKSIYTCVHDLILFAHVCTGATSVIPYVSPEELLCSSESLLESLRNPTLLCFIIRKHNVYTYMSVVIVSAYVKQSVYNQCTFNLSLLHTRVSMLPEWYAGLDFKLLDCYLLPSPIFIEINCFPFRVVAHILHL